MYKIQQLNFTMAYRLHHIQKLVQLRWALLSVHG